MPFQPDPTGDSVIVVQVVGEDMLGNRLISIFGLLTMVTTGCGPAGRHISYKNIASQSSGGPAGSLVINKANLVAVTRGSVQVAGSCINQRDIEFTSVALAQPTIIGCSNSQFQVDLHLTGADGRITITAKQLDGRGTPVYANISFDKDGTAPKIEISTLAVVLDAAGVSVPANRMFSVAGICETDLSVTIDGDVSSKQVLLCNNGMFSGAIKLTAGEGTKGIRAVQNDAAGNMAEATRSILNDETAPNISVVAPAQNGTVGPLNAQFSGACESGLNVRLESASFQNPYVVPCTTNQYSQFVQFTGADGQKSVNVIQTDASGNRRLVTRAVNVVTPLVAPPAVTIASPPANTLTRDLVQLQGACETGLAVSVQGAVAAQATTACANGQYSVSVSLSAGDGVKSVTVLQTRPPNTVGTTTRNFVKDATPPALSIVAPVANASVRGQVAISGTCESGLQVQIQGTLVTTPQSLACAGGMYSATLTVSNGDGAKTVTVAQTDAAGNSATVSRNVTKDTVAPMLSITAPLAGAKLMEDKVNLSGVCESGLGISVSGSGVAQPTQVTCQNSTFASAVVLKPGVGNKEVQVAQTDAAGNMTSDLRTFERLADAVDGKLLYANNCASCHGALAMSTKINRTAQQITAAVNSIASMSALKILTAIEVQAIADALKDGGSTPPINDMAPYYPGRYLPVATSLTCDSTKTGASNDRIRRLTTLELVNSLTMYFGAAAMSDSSVVATLPLLPNEPDTGAVEGFNNNIYYVEALFEVGRAITDFVFATNARIDGVLPSCSAAPTGTACKNSFASLAKRIFRRPITATEKTELETFIAEFTDKREGLRLAVLRLLMSPHFHQHMEMDESAPSADGRFRLNQYEIASRLAFRITEAGPDNTLMTAADQGALATAAQIRAQAARLVETPAAKAAFKRFLIHWLELEPKVDPNAIMQNALGIDPRGFGGELAQEFSRFVDQVVFTANGSFKDLLTAQYIFPETARLAKFFNVTQSANAVASGPERAGILLRPIFSKSSLRESGIIGRGLIIRKQFLCTNLPSPSATIIGTRLDEVGKFSHLDFSNREIITRVTDSPVCLSCHAQINPPGFVFESYGPFGNYRTTESVYNETGQTVATHPIDTVVPGLIVPGREPATVSSSVQFVQQLGQSDSAMRCFSQQIHRYSRMREPQAVDGCGLNATADLLRNGGSIKNSIVENASSDEIFWRRRGN